MNKKSLKEVFEFFPDAKWITQDSRETTDGWIVIYFQKDKPLNDDEYYWNLHEDTCTTVSLKTLMIDWGNRKTWKSKCVSREEIINLN